VASSLAIMNKFGTTAGFVAALRGMERVAAEVLISVTVRYWMLMRVYCRNCWQGCKRKVNQVERSEKWWLRGFGRLT
jgi:hypothetical protein